MGQTLYLYGRNYTYENLSGVGWGYYYEPDACPSGWSDAGRGFSDSSNKNLTRTCYHSSQICSSLYLYGRNYTYENLSGVGWGYYYEPDACPSGWSDAGRGFTDSSNKNLTRTCYKCN